MQGGEGDLLVHAYKRLTVRGERLTVNEKQHCCTKSGVPLRKLRTKDEDEDDNYEKRRKLKTKRTKYRTRNKTNNIRQR